MLYDAGFVIERMVEETDSETMNSSPEFSSAYYATAKAKLIPLSFVMKARKLYVERRGPSHVVATSSLHTFYNHKDK